MAKVSAAESSRTAPGRRTDAASEAALDPDIAAIRRFNRFHTSAFKITAPKLLGSPFSLTEARIMYELGQQPKAAASELVRQLGIDAGQLSRILGELQQRQMVSRQPSGGDRRQSDISLTAKGRTAFAKINRASQDQVAGLIRHLSHEHRARLVGAMAIIERTMAPQRTAPRACVLRTHRPGDIGWIISRHGALYAQEYGWDISFEAMVAEIAAQFIRTHDPARERCWIAEVDGETVGSVCLVKASNTVAKLRLLIVDPSARGLGVGRALTMEVLRFAREAGYTSIELWTQSILVAARAIYRQAGFRLIREEPHHSFGHDLIGETWSLALDSSDH